MRLTAHAEAAAENVASYFAWGCFQDYPDQRLAVTEMSGKVGYSDLDFALNNAFKRARRQLQDSLRRTLPAMYQFPGMAKEGGLIGSG